MISRYCLRCGPATPPSVRQSAGCFGERLRSDFKNGRIGWLGDLDGYLPFEPGVIDLCEQALESSFAEIGCHIEPARFEYPLEQLWADWIILRAWLTGGPLVARHADPAKRMLMKEEACFEVEQALRLSAMDVFDASGRRSDWCRAMDRLFARYDLPLAICSDNGVPFASPNALFNLSKLSVWRLRLRVAIERIKPGHPQQNGRHERMHLTLKKEAARPPGFNSLQQQDRFDAFVREFNAERPHQALGMKYPAELYTPSARSYEGLPELTYPFHDRDVLVTACGRLSLHRKRINISTVLAGQKLGHAVVTHVLGMWCCLCVRAGHARVGGGRGTGFEPSPRRSAYPSEGSSSWQKRDNQVLRPQFRECGVKPQGGCTIRPQQGAAAQDFGQTAAAPVKTSALRVRSGHSPTVKSTSRFLRCETRTYRGD
jgi:Integrase core domain